MNYEEIFAKAKEALGSADVSSYEGHLAIQINITGEGEGIFYAEINEGKLYIQPYDYKENDAVLTAEGEDIIKIFNGTLDPVEAFEAGKLSVTGDITKALSIQPVIENNKKSAKKTTASTKKTAAKKPAADKKKDSAVKEAKSAAKSAPKAPKPSVKKADEETKTIVGLAEPKKTPAKATAPKAAAKKTPAKAAKGSTKSVKKASTSSKNKKG